MVKILWKLLIVLYFFFLMYASAGCTQIESIGYTEEPSKEDGAEFKENANVLFNILGTWYRESDSLEVTVAQFSVWNEHKTESAQTSYMSGALKTNKTKWVYLYTCRNYTLYITDRNGDVIELKRIIK